MSATSRTQRAQKNVLKLAHWERGPGQQRLTAHRKRSTTHPMTPGTGDSILDGVINPAPKPSK
jgi:hypothetical protein